MTQSSCMVSTEGHLYMSEYDMMPYDVRRRIQNSKFNLCAACLAQYFFVFRNWRLAIEYMEGVIDGKDMGFLFSAAIQARVDQKYIPGQYFDSRFDQRYIPEYFDDREYKVKRDWYTQRMDLVDKSYLIDTRKIYKITDYL